MIPPRGSTRRFVAAAAAIAVAAAVAMTGSEARAEDGMAFRKKKAPSTDTTAGEASPSGGEAGAADGEEAPPKVDYVPQAEDRDRPRDPSLLDKNRADAALAKKKKKEEPPFYEKWQFWTVTGAAVVGAVILIFAVPPLVHEIKGGDPHGCPMATGTWLGCFP